MAKLMQREFLPGQWVEWKNKTAESLTISVGVLGGWLRRNWFRLLLLGILAWLLSKKDLTLQLSLQSSQAISALAPEAVVLPTAVGTQPSPALATRNRQLAYVEKFSAIARQEMRASGIPASIKLAQALLETNAGASPLAVRNNNHFGIKCFSRTCTKGHCTNFSDDSHKDFFRIYPSARESYRSHSQFLRAGQRYAALFELEPTDYRAWAKGLAEAGYATDKKYASKLISLIERLELYRYDS